MCHGGKKIGRNICGQGYGRDVLWWNDLRRYETVLNRCVRMRWWMRRTILTDFDVDFVRRVGDSADAPAGPLGGWSGRWTISMPWGARRLSAAPVAAGPHSVPAPPGARIPAPTRRVIASPGPAPGRPGSPSTPAPRCAPSSPTGHGRRNGKHPRGPRDGPDHCSCVPEPRLASGRGCPSPVSLDVRLPCAALVGTFGGRVGISAGADPNGSRTGRRAVAGFLATA